MSIYFPVSHFSTNYYDRLQNRINGLGSLFNKAKEYWVSVECKKVRHYHLPASDPSHLRELLFKKLCMAQEQIWIWDNDFNIISSFPRLEKLPTREEMACIKSKW